MVVSLLQACSVWGTILLAAAALAVATGGRRFSWARARFDHTWLLVVAGACAFLPVYLNKLLPSWVPAVGTAAGTCAVLACLVWNWGTPGALAMAVGVALNLAVIGANGGRMPIEQGAVTASGRVGTEALTADCSRRHCIASSTTKLRFLDDRIPIRPQGHVVSIGDLVLYAGAGWWLMAAMGSRLTNRFALPLNAERPMTIKTEGV